MDFEFPNKRFIHCVNFHEVHHHRTVYFHVSKSVKNDVELEEYFVRKVYLEKIDTIFTERILSFDQLPKEIYFLIIRFSNYSDPCENCFEPFFEFFCDFSFSLNYLLNSKSFYNFFQKYVSDFPPNKFSLITFEIRKCQFNLHYNIIRATSCRLEVNFDYNSKLILNKRFRKGCLQVNHNSCGFCHKCFVPLFEWSKPFKCEIEECNSVVCKYCVQDHFPKKSGSLVYDKAYCPDEFCCKTQQENFSFLLYGK
jgi:hypothetical protein